VTWAVFATIYAVLLAIPFARAVRHMRLVAGARPRLAELFEEWRRRTIEAVLDGTGDVPVGIHTGSGAGVTLAFRLIVADGRTLDVPADLHLEVVSSLGRIAEARFVIAAGTALDAYISTLVDAHGESAYRTLARVAPGSRVILVERGYNPARITAAAVARRWRPARVALLVALYAGLTCLVAWSAAFTMFALAGALVLAADAVFLQSGIVILACTQPG